MISETAMLEQFRAGYEFPPLLVRLSELDKDARLDALLDVASEGKTYQFDAEFKSRSSPRAFEDAVSQIMQMPRQPGRLPMVVLPYLREAQLNELQERRVSGLDLSGNGVVIVPGKLLVYRTGRPNRFPDSAPTKYAYRGATSLVSRAFLCRTEFKSLGDIEQEVRARGGSVVLSTISKALKRLESDLIVDRTADLIRLRQPDKLLEKLAESYSPPKVSRTVTLSAKTLLSELFRIASPQTPLVLSGRSSTTAYAVMGRSEPPLLYTPSIDSVLRNWGQNVEQTSRFVDLELSQTDEPTVYFDARKEKEVAYSSPVQVFLECFAGDKRERETSLEVKKLILRKLQK
jgi:hypothetical protein